MAYKRKNRALSTRDLNEKINSLKTAINYFEVIKEQFKQGQISFNEIVNYNLMLFKRRSAFIDLFYEQPNRFKEECNFSKRDLINLLNY